MPRERITPVATQGCDPSRARAVDVGWTSGRLQVGVATLDGRSLNWQSYGDDRSLQLIGAALHDRITEGDPKPTISEDDARELGRAALDAVDVVGSYESQWTESLGRYDANQLIKLLRKARDRAFGADA